MHMAVILHVTVGIDDWWLDIGFERFYEVASIISDHVNNFQKYQIIRITFIAFIHKYHLRS